MSWLHWILVSLVALLGVGAAGHALLYKRDPRSALGWIAVCMMFPVAGALLYFLFGINRVRSRARELRERWPSPSQAGYGRAGGDPEVRAAGPDLPAEFTELARISDAVSRRPLLDGNRIDVLHNGEQAYPVMLEAIEAARSCVYLSTYIFETNHTGRLFIDALAAAVVRGADVRVIVDGMGELYPFPRAGTLLCKAGIRAARFLPLKLFPPALHVNLRNHRKLLVVDGRVGFTGGMNIGDRHLAERREHAARVIDTHFRLAGPVVAQMTEVFLEDWGFCTGEYARPQPPLLQAGEGSDAGDCGTAICRTIVDGPDEDLNKLSAILIGAISAAHRSIRIMTPYFLPPVEISLALQSAALRGVDIRLVLPVKNNLPVVHWASCNLLWEVLERGVRVFYQPPPFVHTKLFVVDDHYAQIGSANLDPRSLRLNFEIAVEVYDQQLARNLSTHIDETCRRSREVLIGDVDGRRLWIRTRDALAWLFSPYL